MSDYFNRLPEIRYQDFLSDQTGIDKIQIKNLFRRGKLREDIFNDITVFDRYFIRGDERPDNVARKLYDDPNLDWVILITNNILNIQSEWPIPTNLYEDYLLDKYGTFEEIYSIHHYESREVKDTDGSILFPPNLHVDENILLEYYDEENDDLVTISDISRPVTNYEYEERQQEKKRTIFTLKPRYLNIVFEDLEEIMTYDKGSTDYISGTVKDTRSGTI